VSTPVQDLTVPPVENLRDRRGYRLGDPDNRAQSGALDSAGNAESRVWKRCRSALARPCAAAASPVRMSYHSAPMATIEQGSFRILALSGGGVRGLFQAKYLSRLEGALGSPLHGHFELVAGTSTGAIIALAIALEVDLKRVANFYETDGAAVFAARWLARLRSGPLYSEGPLRTALEKVFGDKRLRDCKVPVLIPAVALDRFRHRVFSAGGGQQHDDRDLFAVDVAQASAAAPRFFPAAKPQGEDRSYVDGGLWANSPSLLAALVAQERGHAKLEQMRVLSVGNGDVPKGARPDDYAERHQLSIAGVRDLFEMMFASQETFANEQVEAMLPSGHLIRVAPTLQRPVQLDDVQSAVEVLPALAEEAFEKTKTKVVALLTRAEESAPKGPNPKYWRPVANELVQAAGLSGFYPSRDHYSSRRDASRIDRYISTAQQSIFMVSINLMTGLPVDGILDVVKGKLEGTDSFEATISLLDPERDYLMQSVAPVLGEVPGGLASDIRKTIERLKTFRDRDLSRNARGRFQVRAHAAIPFGSAIMLDRREPFGRIQIETKAYAAPVRKSFAFEVMPTGEADSLYSTLRHGYEQLVKDGRDATVL
jgi:uncharacterized protein